MPDIALKPEPNVIGRDGMNPRQRVVARNAKLRNILSRWITHWRDINDFILPRRLSYLASDKNDGSKKNGRIIRSTATKAARILGAGKLVNETSPVRPWFRFKPPRDLAGNSACTTWAAQAETIMYSAMSLSNIYAALYELWFGQGTFGTAALYVEEDDKRDFNARVFPLGQYALASSGKGRIDQMYRDFCTMTVEEVVVEFGLDNCSPTLRLQWQQGDLDSQVEIIHKIEPNRNRVTGKIDNLNMPFRSEWWEKVCTDDWNRPLRIMGYEEQPFMVARWNVLGDDLYGSDCPGMDALGDTKGQQHVAIRRAEAFDKGLTPPTKAPVSARTSKLSLLPGDNTYIDETAQGTKFEPIIEVKPEWVSVADKTLSDDDRRIFSIFFADLFQMFLLDDSQQPRTATDINRRYEEKMLQLGPVVLLDITDVLDPLLKRIYAILIRRGKIPPPPPELEGRVMEIEYVSNMAQAQKLLGSAATERALSILGSVSAVKPEVLDLYNFDAGLRNYFDMIGVRPDEVNPEEVVTQLRQARAQREQEAQAMQQAQGTAEAAKAASQAQMTPDSLLSRLMAGAGVISPDYGRS